MRCTPRLIRVRAAGPVFHESFELYNHSYALLQVLLPSDVTFQKTSVFPKASNHPVVQGRNVTWYPLTTKSKHFLEVTVTTTSKTSAVGDFSAYTFTINAAGVGCPSPPQNVTVSTTFFFCGTLDR